MTPGARVLAAIECLDRIAGGEAAEKVLTGWARGARYAGSKDRAAVRDHVYDVLRQKRACAARGGDDSGRALMLGLIRLQGGEAGALFSGIGHAPAPLSGAESAEPPLGDASQPEVPDWLMPLFEARFGAGMAGALAPLARRAEVFLRVNGRKATLAQAREALIEDGIATEPVALASGALRVIEGARKVARSSAYLTGLVELQDAASQAAMETLPLRPGMTVLDYCAGGGGKTLALAGRAEAQFFAHDANPGRMRDLPVRAGRAGVNVRVLESAELAAEGPYDLVLCDVPCSGSGTWRRDPDAKWRFTPERLKALMHTQGAILEAAAPLVGAEGRLVYATCSLLAEENDARIAAFLACHRDWRLAMSRQWELSDGADGFFVAHLCRA